MSTTQLERLLSEFFRAIGLGEFQPTADDYDCLSVDGSLLLALKYDVGCEVGNLLVQLGYVNENREDEITREILDANVLWRGTGGVTLGRDSSTGVVTLSCRERVEHRSHPGFESLIDRVIANSQMWAARSAAVLTKDQLQPDLDLQKAAVASTHAQWRKLDAIDPKPGDIMIKKVFAEQEKTPVENAITSAQQLLKGLAIDKAAADGEKAEFPSRGDPSSSHMAIAVSGNRLAEAEGGGLTLNDLESRTHNNYLVFRPKPEFEEQIAHVAERLSVAAQGAMGGRYRSAGAAASSFRDTVNSQRAKDQIMDSGMRYQRPDLFDRVGRARGERGPEPGFV